MKLKNYLACEQMEFSGHQLQGHWAQENFSLEGESIVAFLGPFNPRSQMVVFPQSCELFRKRKMLHLVVEHLHTDLEKLSLQQRLLVYVLKEKLNHRLKGDLIQRWGSNLFYGSAQITAAASELTASSAVIYLGVNIEGGEPKSKLWGLEEGGIDPLELAQVVMDQYVFEVEDTRRLRG
jgi:hypothetical protein